MRSLRLIFLSLVAMFVFAASASAWEGQAWQSPEEHLHENVALPFFSVIDKPTTIDVNLLMHNKPTSAHISFLDLQDQGNTLVKNGLDVWGNGQEVQTLPTQQITIDPAKFAHSGYQEIRLRFNQDKQTREFITTRFSVFIVNGKSRSDYSGGPTVQGRCGAGAWYPNIPGNYRIIFVDCRDVNTAQSGVFHPGDVVRVKSQDGGLYVNVDPDFHHGNPGTVLLVNGTPNKWTSVKLPTDITPGAHKLHFRSQTNGEAGAFVLPITVA
jgi:hypothetical protein